MITDENEVDILGDYDVTVHLFPHESYTPDNSGSVKIQPSPTNVGELEVTFEYTGDDDDDDDEDEYSDYEEDSGIDSNVLDVQGKYFTGTTAHFKATIISKGMIVRERTIELLLKFTLEDDSLNLHVLNERLKSVDFYDGITHITIPPSAEDCMQRVDAFSESDVWFDDEMLSEGAGITEEETYQGKKVWGLIWSRDIGEQSNATN